MKADDIIGQTLSGTISHDLGIARITCQTAAARYITCRCGRVLDQSTVRVVEVCNRMSSQSPVVAFFCDKHAIDSHSMLDIARDQGAALRVSTWSAVWTFLPNGDVELSS